MKITEMSKEQVKTIKPTSQNYITPSPNEPKTCHNDTQPHLTSQKQPHVLQCIKMNQN